MKLTVTLVRFTPLAPLSFEGDKQDFNGLLSVVASDGGELVPAVTLVVTLLARFCGDSFSVPLVSRSTTRCVKNAFSFRK